MKKLRVFYNPDCDMYGVQQYINSYILHTGNDKTKQIKKWTQIVPPKGKGARRGQSAYTHYEAVAERWMKELAEVPEND